MFEELLDFLWICNEGDNTHPLTAFGKGATGTVRTCYTIFMDPTFEKDQNRVRDFLTQKTAFRLEVLWPVTGKRFKVKNKIEMSH